MALVDMKLNFMSGLLALSLVLAPLAEAQRPPIQPAQRQALIESIQIMRRLVSAIEVGPTFHQYGNLLIETKIAVDERIAILRGESRVLVADALKAFIDAHDLWRLAITHDDAPIYIIYSCTLFQRYNLTAVDTITPMTCRDVKVIEAAVPHGAKMYHTGWRIKLLDPQLGQIWATAAQRLNAAQKWLASPG
jgi:hypothetical protein